MSGTRSLAVQERDAGMAEAMNAVLELRRARPQPSFRTIGDKLGLSPDTARRYYYEALTITNEYSAQLADAERAEQLDITDRMLDRILPLVTEPRLTKDDVDLGPSLEAADRVIRILERRARVTGSDMPTRVAQTDRDGNDLYSPREFESRFAALADALAASRAPRTDDAPGGSGPGGAPAVHVEGMGTAEPVAAEWSVADVADISGQRLRQVENPSRDGQSVD